MCNTCKHNAGASAPASANKFQTLIDSPDVQPYTSEERAAKTVEISEQQFVQTILPAIQVAADDHAQSRRDVIEQKIEQHS